MKILQVIPYFVPAWDYGGPVQVAFKVSRELVERGHEVTVYTTDTLNESKRLDNREEIIDGIQVKRFRNLNNTLAYNHKIFLSLGMVPVTRKNLRHFDVIHMHEHWTIQNVIVSHYARRYGIPYILQAHGSLPQTTGRRRIKQFYDTIWGRHLMTGSAKVIALTETESEQYQARGVVEDKVEIVPNGIDLSEFEKLPDKGEFRQKYGLGTDDKIILYLGRIDRTKGLDLLVNAFSGFVGETDKVRLVIVGPNSSYSSELTNLVQNLAINDRVLFTGPIYERNRLAAYVDADIFVTPSFLGFPVTFIEACACGTPVVTTEKGDKLDWIDNRAGYIVAYEVNQLRDALVRLVANSDLAHQLGENGKRMVRERFNWSRIVEQLEYTYKEVGSIR